MKKLIVLAVVLAAGLAISLAYAEAPKSTTTTQPTVATTPVKPAPVTPAAPTLESWKCKITAMDAKTLTVENEVTKKITKLNVGTLNVKDYAVGDKVEVKFEKDLLKSIAKAK